MPGKSLHRVRNIVQPSFPNNRLSNRPKRRKVITRKVWKEDFDFQYNTRPEPAFFDPFEAPTLFNRAPVQFFTDSSREIWAALSPTSNDTDGDGLFDGPDVAWEYSLDGKFHIGEESVGTEPLNPDTDGDSANDGQELSGYNLVWMSIGADGSVTEHYANGTTSNPLDARNYGYDARTGETEDRDLDMDGISDWAETHYAEAYPYIVEWANTRQAEWEIAYPAWNNSWGYNSVYVGVYAWKQGDPGFTVGGTSFNDQSDIDEFKQLHPAPAEFNATEYLTNLFNPFVAESLPPIIMWMDVVTHPDYHYWGFVKIIDAFWADVTVEVFDPSPFLFTINVGDGYSSYSSGQTPHGGSWNYTIPLQLNYPGMWAGGYVVNLTVLDYGGHFAWMEKEMDGEFSGVIGFLEWVWSGICGTFAKAWEGVKAAMSFLVDIIVSVVLEIIRPLAESLSSMLSNILMGGANYVDTLFETNQNQQNQLLFNGDSGTSEYYDYGPLYAKIILMVGGIAAIGFLLAMYGPFGNAIASIVMIAIVVAIVTFFFAEFGDLVGFENNPNQNDLQQMLDEENMGAGYALSGLAVSLGFYLLLPISDFSPAVVGFASALPDLFAYYAIVSGVLALVFGLLSMLAVMTETIADDILFGYAGVVFSLVSLIFGIKSLPKLFTPQFNYAIFALSCSAASLSLTMLSYYGYTL